MVERDRGNDGRDKENDKRVLGEDEWETLIHTIKSNNCILMLGPDASFEEVDGGLKPLTEILANELTENELIEKIKTKIEPLKIDNSNLAQVAHFYSIEAGRNGLEPKVKAFYEKRAHLTSEFHNHLAAIPFYFAITSTPDRMFYNALKESGKKPIIEGYNFRGEPKKMVTMGTVDEPLLFYLYGRLKELNSLVLTENDLIDFLVAVVSEDPPLPQNMLHELQKKNKSFLFLGFGFVHWYLRVLLHVLQGDKKQDYSFALEQFPPAANVYEYQQTILYFEEGDCKIHIYNEELKAFVEELRKRYEKPEDDNNSSTKIPVPTSPRIFICHANKDKDFAGYLYERLEKAGFEPWLDKKSLKGGDEWDEVIKKAIEREIDYFVILQSKALAGKIEGYVHKEIKLALDRQDRFPRGIRFIIPVKIEECPLYEELEHLHTIDMSGKNNVKQLITTIRRDQMKRKGDR